MCFLIALFTLFLSHNAIAQSIPMCNGGTVPAGQTCVTPPPGITQTSCAIPVNRNFDGTCNNGFFPARGSTSGDNGNQQSKRY